MRGGTMMTQSNEQTGFSGAGRHITEEDEITLTSVGVDIGSSTSHLVFSKLELERQNTRYVIVRRTILRESEILLTPYADDGLTIDAQALGKFIDRQYDAAKLERSAVDTGALILTGVAVRRSNARAIGELFAEDAGKFVAVSAGDGLEATMAAHGSGAVGQSGRARAEVVMNIDIGGGTSKVAICQAGKVLEVTAIDVGARLLATDDQGAITRIEEAGRFFAKKAGVDVALGAQLSGSQTEAIVDQMIDKLVEVVMLNDMGDEAKALLRLPPLEYRGKIDCVIFSGGVSEFIYGHEQRSFGDMGAVLGRKIKARIGELGAMLMVPDAGIRATVIGASQYTIQVSGSTIFIAPHDIVPIRNIPVVAPEFDLELDVLDPNVIAQSVLVGLTRLGLADSEDPIAVGFHWGGSATFWRLDAFCSGLIKAMKSTLAHGHPLVLVSDGDVGGLIGLHLREELKIAEPVISIDGIDLREFDYIDIGEILASSGSVPVVIKSLVFPGATSGE
jgi:ethanolamine utilization protein EutA